MEPGYVVEFIDSQKIYCAVVLEAKNLRLRLLTENNREVKLSASRLSHHSRTRMDLSKSRDKLVISLKEISARRRLLSEKVDVQGLWDVLHSEQEWVDLPTMTAFAFSESVDSDHEAAVMRAFFNDRLFFKFNTDRFFPHTREKVDQILAQREYQTRQARLIDGGAAWVQKILKGQSCNAPEEAGAITEILISYYLFENESAERATARALLKKAGVTSPTKIFSFLVKQKIWSPHENIDLLRYGIEVDHPEAVTAHAQRVSSRAPSNASNRRDLRHLKTLTIDGPGTQDFDDALSISIEKDHFLLGIHIADVGSLVAKNDPCDAEAMARASSIYMPDQKIVMLPAVLSEGTCSLRAGVSRKAISTLIKLGPNAEVIDYEIVASLIQVSSQLTYSDIDVLLSGDEELSSLFQLAQAYRNRRLDEGALPIELPEITVNLSSDLEPKVSKVDRETTSRFLVAELMILANDVAAEFLVRGNLPAVFRSQAAPRERLFDRDQGSLFQNWMQRKQIGRFILSSSPEPHAGLGLNAYATCTSPIRKYTDLVNQRQIRAALGLETPYQKEEVDFIINTLQEPMVQVGRIQFRRHRYWVLKFLEGCIGQKEEALILNRRREGYAILLLNYMIETTLSGAENITFKPEDLIQITIQHVNARNDVLTVYLG